MRPTLGIIDPFHARTMPKNVAAYSGFDVLWCVFVQSYVCILSVLHNMYIVT